MSIYNVRSWITVRRGRGQRQIENVQRQEATYTKLKGARAFYDATVADIKSQLSMSYRGEIRTGHVELYIPHVHKNGLLAYWPDNGNYIAKFEMDDQGGR